MSNVAATQLSIHHCYNAAWNAHETDFEVSQFKVMKQIISSDGFLEIVW